MARVIGPTATIGLTGTIGPTAIMAVIVPVSASGSVSNGSVCNAEVLADFGSQ